MKKEEYQEQNETINITLSDVFYDAKRSWSNLIDEFPTDERRMNDASTDERPLNGESIYERFHLLSMAEMRRTPCVATSAWMAFHTPTSAASCASVEAA